MSLSFGFSGAATPEKHVLMKPNKSQQKTLLCKTMSSTLSFDHFCRKKEAPFCTSEQGSYTIEAAVVLPVFISFMVFILFFMRIFLVEAGVQKTLEETGRQAAAVCLTKEETPSVTELATLCNAKILAEQIPVSYIDGNLLGIRYSDSQVDDNYIRLVASYDITFPIRLFGKQTFHVLQQSRNRKWVGWDSTEGTTGDYVYVTETGTVYHTKLSCTYLHPSIQACSYTEVAEKRSESGSKYNACKVCRASKVKSGTIFITDYGNVYHSSLQCSSIKRKIYRKQKSDVANMRGCSKCGG